MVFVLKRTPAFQLFGPFQTRSQALDWVKQHANERRFACCILEPIEPREGQVTKAFVPRGKTSGSMRRRLRSGSVVLVSTTISRPTSA